MIYVVALIAAVAVAAVVFFLTRRAVAEQAGAARNLVAREAEAIRAAASAEAAAIRKHEELEAMSAAQDERRRVDEALRNEGDVLAARALAVEEKSIDLERKAAQVTARGDELGARDTTLQTKEAEIKAVADEARRVDAERAETLVRIAGIAPDEIKTRLVTEWIDDARAAAADKLRHIDAGVNDPEHGRSAKRIMDIAAQRYEGHYLTERLLTNVPVLPEALPRILGDANANLLIIEEYSHVKLLPSEAGDAIKLDGQDSFGREIARRAISKFGKNAPRAGEAAKICQTIAEELEREVFELGKKAFKELEIPRAHPDIVKLVGKLNYRTSYTQNQWKHAIEAAFLCGMMADEMGLDVKLARRAALMHDIGKALTHEIDGSHAVIGADIARKLGESEMVANAIGAHHTDEPFNSVYAYLVAAGDAMSGGRPGARRQQDDNYAERLDALQRIAGNFQGVDHVHAVFGGREVRVHVKEDRVSDERAVELSTEIAHRISDELTFPGQIKVTVIREVRAVEIAS